jgi:hypothetical protein
MPPGVAPPVVYGPRLELKRVPDVKPYVSPKHDPIVVEPYEAPDLNDYRKELGEW